MDWGLLGNEWAVDLLAENVRLGRYRHAYLFTGPRGVGRRTLALHFAQALNCPNSAGSGVPCGTCPTCTRLMRMQHPDLMVLQAEEEGGILRVDRVREMQYSLSLTPYEMPHKVAMLLRFEEANQAASNALLKTLEEPPAGVVLLLTAESPEDVLPTILSRCELLRLRPMEIEALAQGLQSRLGLPGEQASLLAHVSGGRAGYAIQLAEQPGLMREREGWLNDLFSQLTASRAEQGRFARRLAEKARKDGSKESLRYMLRLWLSLWRDVLLHVTRGELPYANPDYRVQIEELAAGMDAFAAHACVNTVQQALNRMERNANLQLTLEVLLLDLPRG